MLPPFSSSLLPLPPPLGAPYRTTNGFWKKLNYSSFCTDTPGIPWSTRNDITCQVPF